MTVGAVVLYSVVDGLLSKDNYMSAIVVTVIQIDVTEVHFGIIAHWSILQTYARLHGSINERGNVEPCSLA